MQSRQFPGRKPGSARRCAAALVAAPPEANVSRLTGNISRRARSRQGGHRGQPPDGARSVRAAMCVWLPVGPRRRPVVQRDPAAGMQSCRIGTGEPRHANERRDRAMEDRAAADDNDYAPGSTAGHGRGRRHLSRPPASTPATSRPPSVTASMTNPVGVIVCNAAFRMAGSPSELHRDRVSASFPRRLTCMTATVSMLAIPRSPITGLTYELSVFRHCWRCLAFRQPVSCAVMYVSATSAKVLSPLISRPCRRAPTAVERWGQHPAGPAGISLVQKSHLY